MLGRILMISFAGLGIATWEPPILTTLSRDGFLGSVASTVIVILTVGAFLIFTADMVSSLGGDVS